MTKTKKRQKRSGKALAIDRKHKLKRKRPLHRRLALHPISVLLLLCVGVLLVGSTIESQAASNSTISATIEAPELTAPAVITSPSGGLVSSSSPVSVSGTCPDNSYVILQRNDQMSGVALCNNNGFQIQSDLFAGDNQLMAQDYNTTNEAGPPGNAISVTYEAPSSSTSAVSTPSAAASATTVKTSATSSKGVTTAAIPPLVNSEFQYQATTVGHQFSWSINVSGGTPPYRISVNWGDGSSSNYTFDSDPTFKINHTYQSHGNFVITINTIDALDANAVLQLVAIIHASLGVKTTAASLSKLIAPLSGVSSVFRSIKHYLWVAWPSYVVVLIVVFSFWLGEHEQLRLERRRKLSARR